MDGHKNNAHAASAVQQQQPTHNLDGVQNGLNWINYPDYHVEQSNNGFGAEWSYDQSDNSINATSQSMPLYDDWQQSSVLNNNLDPYGRPYSRSPAAHQQQQPSAYPSNYNASRQTQPSSVYDPNLDASTYQSQQQAHPNSSIYNQPQLPVNATVAPNALDNAAARTSLPQRSYTTQAPVDQRLLVSKIPSGADNGIFTTVDYDLFAKATSSTKLKGFVNIGQQDYEYPINRSAVPPIVPRRSRNDLRRLAAEDPKLLAKLGKKFFKKSGGVPRVKKDLRLQPTTKLVQTSTGVKTEIITSDDDSASETDSSDYDSDDEPDEPSPLPAKRDDEDLKEGIRYDSIKALWRPKRRVLHTASIKSGLKDYWEIVRTIRDRWKADTTALKEAEEKGRNSELPLLKSRVKDQRDMIQVAFKAAVEHGHRSILELSSENLPFLFLCFQFLQDRLSKDDTNGALARSILEILSMCITLTEEKTVKTHLRKMLPRYAKKGDAEVQALVIKTEAAIKDGTKQAAEEEQANGSGKDLKPQSPVGPKTAAAPITASEPVTGVKRSLPAGSTTGQPAKRAASGAPVGSSKSDGTKLASIAKKPATVSNGAIKSSTASTTPAVRTTKMTVSKPSSFFNAMQSATKKPATTAKPPASSVLAAALKQAEKRPAAANALSSKADAAAKSAFSFAGTMANLAKPKEKAPSPKPEEETAIETPEQKTKRLRKEARRGLRVTFRPDAALEEIRYFTHDPDEEVGHDANMTRDVGDVGGEGRMFKQHKDMMEMDEEEEGPSQEDLKPWREPTLLDHTATPQENYERYGGGQKPESPETKIREEHDANVLLVFYTDPKDIPPNPKEPPEETETADTAEYKDFGIPTGNVADRDRKLRLNKTSAQELQGGQTAAINADVASILAALAPPAAQPPPTAQAQPPPVQGQAPDLTQLLAQLAQSQQQQSTAAAPPTPAAQQQTTSAPDFANLFASLGQSQPQPQPQQPATQHLPPQMQNPADLANLFTASQQNPGAPLVPPNFTGFPNGFPMLPPGFPYPGVSQQQQQQQNHELYGQQQGYPFENEERRRWREQQEQAGQQEVRPQYTGAKKKSGADRKFTLPCKFWSLGKCQKGDKCTYRHD